MTVENTKSQIINLIKRIGQLKEAKKNSNKSYNEDIAKLEEEVDAKLLELEEKERADLEEEADELIEK